METFLGIDGGGTKTKLILSSRGGKILAEVTRPTCSHIQVGFSGVTAVLSEGVDEICRKAGAARGDIVHAFVGTSCYGDVETDNPLIRAAVKEAMGSVPHTVGNDSENSLAGTLAGACGISLICGTGSIACGRNEAGTVMRCGGWHHELGGDEGSGWWMGHRLLHLFTRQSDGRAPRTALYGAVRTALGISADSEVVPKVVDEWGLDRTKIASLSRLVGSLYAAGDPNAADILAQAAAELAELAEALYRRLGFEGAAPVSYSGGVFSIGEPVLSPLRSRLAAAGMELRPPKLPPDVGALILAFRYAGVPVPESLSGGEAALP